MVESNWLNVECSYCSYYCEADVVAAAKDFTTVIKEFRPNELFNTQ